MSRIFRVFSDQEGSIRRIFNRYFKNADDVNELTQETFLKAFAAEMKTDIREPKAFLFRTAKNLALTELQKQRIRKTDSIEDYASPEVLLDDRQVSADEIFDGKRKLMAFTKAIANLPDEYRIALLMRKVDKLKFKQIATRLGVSVSTVEKRVAMALLLCQDYLQAQGFNLGEFGAKTAGENKPAEPATLATIPGKRN